MTRSRTERWKRCGLRAPSRSQGSANTVCPVVSCFSSLQGVQMMRIESGYIFCLCFCHGLLLLIFLEGIDTVSVNPRDGLVAWLSSIKKQSCLANFYLKYVLYNINDIPDNFTQQMINNEFQCCCYVLILMCIKIYTSKHIRPMISYVVAQDEANNNIQKWKNYVCYAKITIF